MDIRIGAYDADAWSGLVFSDRPGEGFGLVILLERGGELVDGTDFFWLLHEAGPHEPAGRYARIAFDLDLRVAPDPSEPAPLREGRDPDLVLEWGRAGERGVIGRVRTVFDGTLLMRPCFPWDWAGDWTAVGIGERTGVSASRRSALALTVDADVLVPPPDADAVDVRVPVSGSCETAFAAWLDVDAERALEAARRIRLDRVALDLEHAAAEYAERRPRVTGHLEGIAAAVSDNIRWMVLLQPETGRRYAPAGRRWIFPRAPERGGGRDHWTVFGWDSYFNALELGLESPDAAREALLAGLETAYPNGCVPNWRGRFGGTPDRSQPPVGSLATLKLHLRRPDLGLLEAAWPRLLAWNRWWTAERNGRPRRGRGPRGLLTWGSDRGRIDPLAPPWERDAALPTLAGWESGQDDLPTWDEAEPSPAEDCLAIDPVDLNAYRVLDLECLSRIADELGLKEDASALAREADVLRERVNDLLWDDERETYADRRWDGSFATCRTASHFLVLTAGIAPADRARRMVEHLTDPELFWGDFVIPTISRNDPRFGRQQYWRGSIWPPINYLVRLGLERYGFDRVSGALACRGARMFRDDWRRTGLCRENFDSRTGAGAGQRHQSWGPLFALAALEELVDVSPWSGLRFGGCLARESTHASNLSVARRRFDVSAGPSHLRISADGRPVLECDGAAVLRHTTLEPSRFEATISCETDVELVIAMEGDRFGLRLDGSRQEIIRPRVRVEAGIRRISLAPLD